MESVRAYESGACGADPLVDAHTLDRLAGEGVLFKNFYANSYHTARAEFANSFFFPARQVQGSPETIARPRLSLLTWPSLLKRHGYATPLWIGSYTPTYDNKQEFLSHHGIDAFYSSLPKGFRKVGWGPSDEDLFSYAFDVLSAQRAPYFAEIMTLSDRTPSGTMERQPPRGPPRSAETPCIRNMRRVFFIRTMPSGNLWTASAPAGASTTRFLFSAGITGFGFSRIPSHRVPPCARKSISACP